MHQLRLALRDAVQIDNVDVGLHAFRQCSTVIEAEDARGGTGHPAYGFLDGEQPLVADPVGKQERGPAGVHDLADVGAGVADAREHPVQAQERLQALEVLIEEADVEHRLAVRLQHLVEPKLYRVYTCGLRHAVEAVFGTSRVGRAIAVAEPEVGPRALFELGDGLRLVDEHAPCFPVAYRRQAASEVELADLGPCRRREQHVRGEPGQETAAAGQGQAADVEPFLPHRCDGVVVARAVSPRARVVRCAE